MRRVSMVIGVLLCLIGCAPPGVPVADPNYDAQGKRFEAPASGMAAIYIVNADRPGSLPPLNVGIGSRQLGDLASNTWFRVELAPGTYGVRATGNAGAAQRDVSLWPGDLRFLVVYLRPTSAVAVEEVSQERGREYVLAGRRTRESQ